MSKAQSLGWATLCAVTAFACYAIPGLSLFGTFALIVAIFFGGLTVYKFDRDQNIIMKAKLDAVQEPKQLTVEMTSPGSNRLFVPKPLDRP